MAAFPVLVVPARFLAGVYIVAFTEIDGNRIGIRDPDGNIQEFPIPTPDSGPTGVALGGVDGFWFTEFRANKIGKARIHSSPADFPRFVNDGFVEFSIPTPASGPTAITDGPGGLWFTESLAGKIGRITPDGTITEFAIPTANSGPAGITATFDFVWFTERNANKIGRLDPEDGDCPRIPHPDSGERAGGDRARWRGFLVRRVRGQ